MNINSFFERPDFAPIHTAVSVKQPFSVRKTHKEDGTTFTITLEGRFIPDDLAHDIWNDCNYLVDFQADYSGKLGWGGKGFATADLSQFKTWEDFKEFIDRSMKYYGNYDIEIADQLCLF